MTTPDDEKTVLRPGPVRPGQDSGNGLLAGTRLAEFELLREIGDGGFSIVYLAQDHSLDRRVALKEYMPSALAARADHSQVFPKSDRYRDTFDAGLRSFINEAKLLARFDHPSLVKVYRFWEANGTAYMVMPFYEGMTLKQWLAALPRPPDEAQLLALLAPLTEALAVIHAEACYHRDIAPDNVILLKDSGQPLLLDFGAARRVIGDMTQALTVILKPGFAPVEQYAETPGMKQGPWTDVYAVAATVYFAIVGKTPPPSISRLIDDQCPRLIELVAARYSEQFLAAIDRALGVRPDARTPSIAALRAELGFEPIGSATADASTDRTVLREPALRAAHRPPTAPPPAAQALQSSPPHSAAASRRPALIAAAAAIVLVAAGSAVFYWTQAPSPTVAQAGAGESAEKAPTSTLPGPPTVAAGPAVAPATVPGATLAIESPPAPTAATPGPPITAPPLDGTVAGAAPAPALADAEPMDPRQEFDRVLARQSADFAVQATPAATQLRIGRDPLGFEVRSAVAGYVQVLVLGPDGSLTLLFPNTKSARNQIRPGESLRLPQPTWPLETLPPAGDEHFLVLVTRQPRDYAPIGVGREAWFTKLPTGKSASRLAARHPQLPSLLLGLAANGCNGAGCDDYGAAQFKVTIQPRQGQ